MTTIPHFTSQIPNGVGNNLAQILSNVLPKMVNNFSNLDDFLEVVGHYNERKNLLMEDIQLIQNDEELQLELVNNDPSFIAYISNPSEKVQLRCIEEEPKTFEYIKNPTFNVCLRILDFHEDYIILMDLDKYPELYTKYYFIKK